MLFYYSHFQPKRQKETKNVHTKEPRRNDRADDVVNG